MIESGFLNRDLATLLSRMGHGDQFVLCDAGFAIPEGLTVVDLSLSVNVPTVDAVLAEIVKHFSIEKVMYSREQRNANPAKLEGLMALLGGTVEQEIISHSELKQRSHTVKGVIRTGAFSAYANLILVSGPGDRWIMERQGGNRHGAQ
jgi:D-ribose pyranase